MNYSGRAPASSPKLTNIGSLAGWVRKLSLCYDAWNPPALIFDRRTEVRGPFFLEGAKTLFRDEAQLASSFSRIHLPKWCSESTRVTRLAWGLSCFYGGNRRVQGSDLALAVKGLRLRRTRLRLNWVQTMCRDWKQLLISGAETSPYSVHTLMILSGVFQLFSSGGVCVTLYPLLKVSVRWHLI